jgi:hypothetical protein
MAGNGLVAFGPCDAGDRQRAGRVGMTGRPWRRDDPLSRVAQAASGFDNITIF